MARFSTLYSGSSGNSAVIEEDGRYLLIDMGKSCRTTTNGLKQLQLEQQNLQGILVTHEHIDHIRGLNVFLKNQSVTIYSNGMTLDYLIAKAQVPTNGDLQELEQKQQDIGGFGVNAFEVSHDAMKCQGYRIVTPKGKTVCLATDLGYLHQGLYESLVGCDLLALEANYDPIMLKNGTYPYPLKTRIASSRGHLSNYDAAKQIAQIAQAGCDKFWLCHLSNENNTPFVAKQTVANYLEKQDIEVGEDILLRVARRDEVSEWMEF